MSRRERELRTVEAMTSLYCSARHRTRQGLCVDCRRLLEYVALRLERCPFKEDKPTCARCRVHCYRPEFRERIREVMGYAGPRMLRRHPVLALLHWLDGFKRPAPGAGR